MPQTAFSRANFNPRSRVGNDNDSEGILYCMLNFNPRSRVGNDHILRFGSDVGSISIHVPAWGTTKNPQRRAAHLFPFQSTFPRGERLKWVGKNELRALFQSTFPRGERLDMAYHFPLSQDFNPRSRVGNDKHVCFLVSHSSSFNPRSRVGQVRNC